MGRSDPLRADAPLREAGAAQHPRLPGALLSDPGKGQPLWPDSARAAAFDVFGIGQVSLDRVERVGAGEPGEPGFAAGGQVATTMLALRRLGLRVAYAGAVGDDAAAEQALAPLRAAGVDCSAVKRVAGGRTRSARVRVDAGTGERSVEPLRDPGVALAPADLGRAPIAEARALHLDAEDPEASGFAADLARAAGIPVVLDADCPGPRVEALLARVDFPIVSQAFADRLAGSARDALARLCTGPVRLAVVTLGERGALARAPGDGRVVEVPGFAVAARDTTGAGDAFRAGFLWGLLEGLDARRVLRAACATGALNCLAAGAQGGLPDRTALEAFLAAHP